MLHMSVLLNFNTLLKILSVVFYDEAYVPHIFSFQLCVLR